MRRTSTLAGAVLLVSILSAPSALADGPSEIYLGKRSGSITTTGGADLYKWVDKQYRSTSLPNLRKHSIRVTHPQCGKWKARASVKWGSTVDTVEASASGCNESVLLTPMGDMNANVTLTIHSTPGDMTGTASIKPVG
ncbi:hypothetical protein OG399_35395 [Streptomyces achromogenes]|uniref:Uncharacterized protein n=1 Tax=Streptomyces achromogenes TaxID=67255 RepID=A0ABZ1KZH1_STRAH